MKPSRVSAIPLFAARTGAGRQPRILSMSKRCRPYKGDIVEHVHKLMQEFMARPPQAYNSLIAGQDAAGLDDLATFFGKALARLQMYTL